MKTKMCLTALFLGTIGASAQVVVNTDGSLQLGSLARYTAAAKTSSGGIFSGTSTADVVLTSATDSVQKDPNAQLTVLGSLANNAGGFISFGDGTNVGIGEYGYRDSDILGLVGTKGISYVYNKSAFSGSSTPTVFLWTPSTNAFMFYTDVRAKGILLSSDMRMKKDVAEIEQSEKSLFEITPVTYRFEEDEEMAVHAKAENEVSAVSTNRDAQSRLRYGFIAQEVKEIFPDLVVEDEDGYLAIDYVGFIPLLVDAVKSLSSRLEEVEASESSDINVRRVSETASVDMLETEGVVLKQNKPNPFSTSTVIEYNLPESFSEAYMCIYDLKGTQLQSMPLKERGVSSVTVSGDTLRPGMYIYTLIADGKEVVSKRMILTD